MQLPGWLQSWKWDQRWQETGFEFLDEAAFLDELAQFMDREADLIVFAEAKDLSIAAVCLAYQPLVEHQIFAIFQGCVSHPLAIWPIWMKSAAFQIIICHRVGKWSRCACLITRSLGLERNKPAAVDTVDGRAFKMVFFLHRGRPL